jgi:hypothetical protein
MRGPGIVTLALALACSVISVAAQQPDVRLAQSTVETQKVTGTVKTTTDNGIVVVGRDTANTDREWTFVVDSGTRIEAGGQARAASDLRQGDPVTVTYMSRDGKVVAQSVTVNPR